MIEDDRLQKIHYQKYSSVYYWKDAILVSEFLATVLLKCESPGKYLSYLKNLIDGDTEPGKERKGKKNKNKNNNNQKLVHYRDILASIGNNYREIPKPINPHLVKNLSRVPWVDFKLLPLPFEVYDHPDIFLKPGDLVRIWRPKKFVYHCGVYLGNKRIIHISNGIQNDAGMSWRNSLFQSGSSAPPKYYDYGKKMKQQKEQQQNDQEQNKQIDNDVMNVSEGSDNSYDKINAPDVAVYDDEDDMDLVGDDSDKEEEDQHPEFKEDELIFENQTNYNLQPGEYGDYGKDGNETFPPTKHSGLLYQDIDEFKGNAEDMNEKEQEYARRARECEWKEFLSGSRKKDLELGYFVFPWRKPDEIVYTAKFLTEIHYMKGQYSVVKNNCEHFSLYCCTGLRYSPQANTIESVMNVASKIGSFAGSLFSKVSFGRSNKDKDKDKKPKKDKKEEKADENRKNHPVLQSQELDDGGDDELEKILLNDGKDGDVLVFGDDKKDKSKNKKNARKEQQKKDEYDVSIDLNGNDNENKKSVFIDEYNDEEDELAQSMILDQNENVNDLEYLSRMDSLENMTPGGLTSSEILVAKKHYNQQRQNYQDQQSWQV